MAPTSSTEFCELPVVARRAITARLAGEQWHPSIEAYNSELSRPGACFVTLMRQQRLRGCIGSLEPERPLVLDAAHNAMAAAFHDPRFAPLGAEELDEIHIEISVLLPAEPLPALSRRELIERLSPGHDGLIVAEGRRRATFLPSVWSQLPDPAAFVSRLLEKAGFSADYWSPTLRISRYRAVSVQEGETD